MIRCPTLRCLTTCRDVEVAGEKCVGSGRKTWESVYMRAAWL